MRGLRYVFNIPKPSISKISNPKVIKIVNETLKKEKHENQKPGIFSENMQSRTFCKPEDFQTIKQITQLIKEKQQALLGHIPRADDANPERRVTCNELAMPRRAEYRIIGGPKKHWFEEDMRIALRRHEDMDYESDNEDHALLLTSVANERML